MSFWVVLVAAGLLALNLVFHPCGRRLCVVEGNDVLGRALEQEPTPRLWSLLGDMSFMDKDYEGSMDAYRRSALSDTASGRAWLMMGYSAIQLEQYAAAIPPLEQASAFGDVGDKASQLLSALRAMTE